MEGRLTGGLKKVSKAIHILVPCFKKIKDEDTGDETDVLALFQGIARISLRRH